MRTRAIGFAVALALWLFANGGVAHSQSYYRTASSGVKATHIYRLAVVIPACSGVHTFQTSNLSAGADTVIHLVENNVEIAWNDDYAMQLYSRVVYNAPCDGVSHTVTAYVRAKSNASGGDGGKTYNMYLNGNNLGVKKLGGYIAATGNVTLSTNWMDTVLVNNGAKATYLLRLVYSGGHYRFDAGNQSSGVGLASKLAGSASSSEQWVIGTPDNGTQEGPVHLVRNDVASGDTDLDGLGNGLEGETCTCSNYVDFFCGGHAIGCSSISTAKDTDEDGLRDDWEVIGVDHVFDPMLFPYWGASPLHQDIFVEVDKHKSTDSNMSQSNAVYAAARLAEAPVTNWDGVGGIAAHFDIGLPCPGEPGDNDNIRSQCGNYLGHSIVPHTETIPKSYPPCLATGYQSLRSDARRGKFHWMWTGAYVGPAQGGLGGVCTWVGSTTGGVKERDAVHELGHNLGLEHWGADSGGMANGKPSYRSVMNYAYSNITGMGFSDGSRSVDPMDPRSLSETTNFGGSGSVDFMKFDPFYFETDSGFPRQFDWNRDGEHDSSVRAHISPPPHHAGLGGLHVPSYLNQESVPGTTTNDSPGAAYFGSKTWLVVNGASDSKFYYATTSALFGSWTTWAQLPSSPTFASDSGPFTVRYQHSGGADHLYVLGMTAPGTLTYGRFDSSGNLVTGTSWESISLPANVTFKEVSAVNLGSRLYVVGANNSSTNPDRVWMGWFDNGTWQGTSLAVASDSLGFIHSGAHITPGIAATPDGKIYVFVRSTRPDSLNVDEMSAFVFDPATTSWTEFGIVLWDIFSEVCVADGRIGAMWRPWKDGLGDQLSSGNGALWVWHSCELSKNLYYRYTWGEFNATTQDFTMGSWHRTHMGMTGDEVPTATRCYGTEVPGTGIALVDHPDNLGAYFLTTGAEDNGNVTLTCPNSVYHVPFADGEATPPTLLNDVNDGVIMQASACTSVHAYDSCFCIGGTCGPPVEGPSVLCDEEN